MDFLRQWIINIVATMIFVSFIEIIMPESSMRKYIRLVVGLLVMIVIINPLLNLAAGEFDMGDRILGMASAINIQDTRHQVENIEEGQRESIILVYRNRLEEQIARQVIEENLADNVIAEVDIEEDFKSERFGTIKGIRVFVHDKGDNYDGIKKIGIDKVEINAGKQPHENTVDAMSQSQAQLSDKISEYLARIYRVAPDKIDVVIRR
ncbi:MAG: hypothetical protein HPY66_3449 [Firmicutes bacterium]|nr:hypothetical protein [Bacillota bacterium]